MLRSRPIGRDGFDDGNSPSAIRSVQSANSDKPFSGPRRTIARAILVMAWPDARRRAHMSRELAKFPSSFTRGARMFSLPSAWQDWQEFLIVSIQAPWVFRNGGIPLPASPVPGNWSAAGVWSIEYQY